MRKHEKWLQVRHSSQFFLRQDVGLPNSLSDRSSDTSLRSCKRYPAAASASEAILLCRSPSYLEVELADRLSHRDALLDASFGLLSMGTRHMCRLVVVTLLYRDRNAATVRLQACIKDWEAQLSHHGFWTSLRLPFRGNATT